VINSHGYLPPSECALVWLKKRRSAKLDAFARTAEAVLR
jgi:hypothetical protein